MANLNDPNQNPNDNIMNQPNQNTMVQPNVQANQPAQNRQRGTGFTNINRILGANVGAGQQLAGRIGGAIQGQGQRVRQNLGQAQQQFQTGFQQARQQALANINAAGAMAKQPGESDEDYEARVANQGADYAQTGQNLRSTSYTGPTGFENPNLLLSQAHTAGALGTFARSGLGQGILARQYGAGRGNYSTGQNMLDQMFLSQDPNAQRSLQQARQSVVGLGEGVQSAASAAEEAAQATQTGVEAAKAKTAEDIQKSTQGILARGGQSAADFNNQMQGIQRLLKGVDEAGNPITEVTPEQQALLDKMDQYGLKNTQLYMAREGASDADIQDIMNQLASGMVLNASGSLNLTDTQRQAAMNLARLQNDPTLQQKMLENKFDTNVFKKDISKVSGALDQAKARDQETRDILLRAGNYMKGQEDLATQRNQAYRDSQLNAIPSEAELEKKYPGQGANLRKMMADEINKGYESAQQSLLHGSGQMAMTTHDTNVHDDIFDMDPNATFTFGTSQPRQLTPQEQAMEYIRKQTGYGSNKYQTEFDQDERNVRREYVGDGFGSVDAYYPGTGAQVAQGLNQAIGGNYGWLAYGDRSADLNYGGPDTIDPRFKGLGLTGTAGRGAGGLRTSEDFLKAADKAVGTTKSLKDLILERIAKNKGKV